MECRAADRELPEQCPIMVPRHLRKLKEAEAKEAFEPISPCGQQQLIVVAVSLLAHAPLT